MGIDDAWAVDAPPRPTAMAECRNVLRAGSSMTDNLALTRGRDVFGTGGRITSLRGVGGEEGGYLFAGGSGGLRAKFRHRERRRGVGEAERFGHGAFL